MNFLELDKYEFFYYLWKCWCTGHGKAKSLQNLSEDDKSI